MKIFKSIATSVLSFFGSSSGTNTALKIVEKVAGVDGMSPKEKADFLLAYQEATKHQSPARRVIAMSFTLLYVITSLCFLGAVIFGADEQAKIFKEFLKDVISNPMNLVIGFYFTMSIANSFKGR